MAIYALGDISPRVHETAWVAPSAQIIGNVILAENSSIWFGAILRGDKEPISVGPNSNIQDNAVLHTDPGCPLIIGEGVTVGHQVMLHGCTIGNNSLIGIGSTILNGSVIGNNCLIGAHTLITENKTIADNSMVMGAPGRVIKTLTEDQIEFLGMGADDYVKNAAEFRKNLKEI